MIGLRSVDTPENAQISAINVQLASEGADLRCVARAILGYLLRSYGYGLYPFERSDLDGAFVEGKTAIDHALGELESGGYLIRERADRTLWIWHITATPKSGVKA